MQWVLEQLGQGEFAPRRAGLLVRSLGFFGLLLVAATWRLWTPQTVFPQVPLFRAPGELPTWCQWLGCAGMVVGLCAALAAWGARVPRWSLVLFAASASGMIVLDQQRLQPWAYQLILAALVLAFARPIAALVLLRLLVISFYFHSALTKLDYSFLHTLGQQFLTALAGIGGLSLESLGTPARLTAAAVFPLGELLVAVLLLFRRTRRIALVGAVTLHLLLLAILGPWGLDHKPAVLIWNVYFIVQDVILFWPARSAAVAGQSESAATVAESFAAPWPVCAMIGAAVVLPFFEPLAWFDMWPSWGLYAAGAQRVVLQVHRRERDQWPEPWQEYLEMPADENEAWLQVRLDRWSLDALGAPVYPQNRVQLGLAEGVAERLGLAHRARVIRFDQAARFTGQRRFAVFRGPAQWESAGDEYFLNSRPRRNLK